MVARKAKAEEAVTSPAVEAPVVESPATETPKEDKKAKVHILPPGAERTLCGIWHQDPRASGSSSGSALELENATCGICLKIFTARANPQKKETKKAEKVGVVCEVCGTFREVFAKLADKSGICPDCNKKARRKRRMERVKAKKRMEKGESEVRFHEWKEGEILDFDAMLEDFEGMEKLRALYHVQKLIKAEIKTMRKLLGIKDPFPKTEE